MIAIYGVIKNYQNKNLKSYILGDNTVKWSTIGLSVMATQASAITFLSTPGQGYNEGMSFIQNYLGMPIALIIVSAFFLPVYFRSKVFIYQYLEERFDFRVRALTSFFFITKGFSMWYYNLCSSMVLLYFRMGYDSHSYFCWTISSSLRLLEEVKLLYTHKYQMFVILFVY